jgi:hypothetical protein
MISTLVPLVRHLQHQENRSCMSDSTDKPRFVNGGTSTESEFLWGCKAIAREIGRTPRQTHHLLTKGRITSAQKKGGSYVAHRIALRKEFGAA